jgi:glycerol-3-phosphate O-acyltransferase / dihydroxyacetone phosphate acyltransferase
MVSAGVAAPRKDPTMALPTRAPSPVAGTSSARSARSAQRLPGDFAPPRAVLDRGLTALARLALRGFYRRVEVTGWASLPRDLPMLVVANHFNALLDAVLVMHALGGLPRFVAKAALWRPPWARPFLWLAGMVPVQRAQDGGDPTRNATMFAACDQHLRQGGTVGLFPEGGLGTTPALRLVRSGAARIALSARAAGTEGLLIVPIGLTYEDKLALRSRALVRVGDPIDLDRYLLDQDETAPGYDDHRTVRDLTSVIARRLREVTPLYHDEVEAGVLGRAADIRLRDPKQPSTHDVSLADREALARQLATIPAERRQPLIDQLARYELHRSLAGLRDTEVLGDSTPGQSARILGSALLRLLLVAPFAIVGAAINALPYGGVHWAGRFVRDPALRASARLLAGVALFPAAWLIAAWLTPWDTWWARALVIVVAPALGLLAVRALERSLEVARAWHGWITRVERREQLDRLRDERRELIDLIDAVVDDTTGSGT